MMTPTISPAGLLSPEQFNQYTEQWVTVASDPQSGVLAPSFQVGEQRMLLLRLPIERVVMLLSTVGVQQIKARFLLVPGAGTASRFAVALYATNAQDERLSAYYLAETSATQAPEPPEQNGGIPTQLADLWLANWQAAPQITAALFATGAGVLQGYNFGAKDFLAPLFADQPFADVELHLSFGLGNYYAADETLTQTFGLLLRVYNQQQPGGTGYDDMAAPCPPGR